jgi:hypothetical protein
MSEELNAGQEQEVDVTQPKLEQPEPSKAFTVPEPHRWMGAVNRLIESLVWHHENIKKAQVSIQNSSNHIQALHSDLALLADHGVPVDYAKIHEAVDNAVRNVQA